MVVLIHVGGYGILSFDTIKGELVVQELGTSFRNSGLF